ncbi:MAG TPA: XrtA system polysaccharide deacetylase [Thermoanaerobaculia bacterium]|nr:XrtA system polysaccharide deacetylase [Thermoanaerobaculia bacterium]
MLTNAFSVDVEDWFQVTAFEDAIPRTDWESMPARVERNTRRLLELCAAHQVRGTFFVLGWVAERWPALVRDVQAAGHELGAHGQDHRRVTTLTPEEFRQDVRRAKRTIEDVSGTEVIGYRAPSYSIVRETLWAVDVLAEEGFRYDSSIFPIRHDRYGIPDFPRFPLAVRGLDGTTLHEFPMSTVRLAGFNLPFVGGGYLRHLPFAFVRWGMRRVNEVEKRPAIVYVHPWEVDPEQPRADVRWATRLRHYRNLHLTERRLAALFDEFRFTTIREVLGL